MKANMSAEGVITISPDSGPETFALRIWLEKATINTQDLMRSQDHHFDPRWIVIETSKPSGKSE